MNETYTQNVYIDDSLEELYEKASDPSIEIDEIEELAENDSYLVRRNIATNPSTPVTVLVKLSEDNQEMVREAVAKNSNTPSNLLEKLAKDLHWKVRIEAESNENFPNHVKTVERLFHETLLRDLRNLKGKEINEQILIISQIKKYFEEFPYVSPDNHHDWDYESIEFEDFADYLDNPIMAACREIASTSQNEEVLTALVDIASLDSGRYADFLINQGEWVDYDSIGFSLISNPNSSSKILETIANNPAIAQDDQEDSFRDSCELFLEHENTSAKVIEQIIMSLTSDRNEYLAIRAIKHPKADPELLANLLDEEFRGWYQHVFEKEVLPVILCQHQLPREKVVDFLEHENEEIALIARILLASRRDTPITELAVFAIDEDIDVRSAAFNNPKATEEIRASAVLLGINK